MNAGHLCRAAQMPPNSASNQHRQHLNLSCPTKDIPAAQPGNNLKNVLVSLLRYSNMGQLSVWHWLVVLLVIVLVFGTRTSNRNAERHPIFSALTTSGKEAEYLNEKLPRKLGPVMLALAAIIAILFLSWWVARP